MDEAESLIFLMLCAFLIGMIFAVIFFNFDSEPSPEIKQRNFDVAMCERLGGHPNIDWGYCNLAGNQVLFPDLFSYCKEGLESAKG